jgi:hypothetical protein
MKLLAKFFWRIVLPFLVALAIAIVELLEGSRGGNSPGSNSGFEHYIVLGLYAAIFCVSFGFAFKNSLRWGQGSRRIRVSSGRGRRV